jgi:hypothetical protein
MIGSKLQLSEDEMELVVNKDIILTKQRIVEKVRVLFEQLVTPLEQRNRQILPFYEALLNEISPKISKGEQYQQLPYVVLDYPRLFGRQDVLAIRQFFWWGNFFSSTFHLKGKYLQQVLPHFFSAASSGKLTGYYYSIEGDEFDFDVYKGNYQLISATATIPIHQLPTEGAFLKICRPYSLQQWDNIATLLLEDYNRYIELLH